MRPMPEPPPPSEPRHEVKLTPAEEMIIRKLRAVEFGSVEVQVQNGVPLFVRKVETTKLI